MLNACSTPVDAPPAPVSWTAAADGEEDTADSTAIVFAFSREIEGLTAEDISVLPDTGEAAPGALSGGGASWTLALTSVQTPGAIQVAITRAGIEQGEKTVAVHRAPRIAWTAEADGEAGTGSTAITFTFEEAIEDLTGDAIHVENETGEAVAGELFGAGTSWTLALTSVQTEGTIQVTITRAGIDNGPASVAVYRNPGPPPPGMGILVYALIVPQCVVPAEGSRIRIEQGGEVLASLNAGGFTAGIRPVTESITTESLALDPGWYVVDMVLAGRLGGSATFHDTVKIEQNETRSLRFEPPADSFVLETPPEEPSAPPEEPPAPPEEPSTPPEEPPAAPEEPPTQLTGQLNIKATAWNSSGLKQTGSAGSGASHIRVFSAPNGKQTVYITVLKYRETQTLLIGGADADKVSKAAASAYIDGDTAGPTRDILALDCRGIAETGGSLNFVITVEEPGRLSIAYTVTLSIPGLSALSASVTKLVYVQGEAFDPSSVVVTGTYGGETREETLYDVEGFDSSVPGTLTVRFGKNGTYTSGFKFTILPRTDARLIFPYGNRLDEGVQQRGRYTVTEGHTLVIAPLLWRIPAGATFQWTVSGGAVTSSSGEFLTFRSGTPAGNYNVTIVAYSGGQPVAEASTTVECVNTSSPPSPDREYQNGDFAPGQNVLGWNTSLGGYGGSAAYRLGVDNGPGDDFRITGNAFNNWVEPGIIWVMKDENRNGKADDTWYELKGNAEELGMKVTRRYAVAFHRNGVWEDNLGNTGKCSSLQTYFSSWPELITLAGTRIELSPVLSDNNQLRGYVDVLDDLYDIDDAIQVDGTRVTLDHIDFVMVQTAENLDAGIFGEKSTEIAGGPQGIGPVWVETRTLAGVGGGGGYTYSFVNNSGYNLTVSFRGVTATLSVPAGTTVPYTSTESKLYYNYSGGNVKSVPSGNTLTFTNG